jgi:hypothetical protein
MRVALLALLLVLAGCASVPPVDVPPWVGRYKNACLPEAVVMQAGLEKVGIKSKVLILETSRWNHAVTVYVYKDRLFVWDSHWKSNQVRAWFDDPNMVGRKWLEWLNQDALLVKAYYL